jgi:prephenate dehydrogenase
LTSNRSKIAVIGGAGKMGQWFVRLLMKEGFQVIAADKDEGKLSELQDETGVGTASTIDAVKEAEVLLLSVTIDRFKEMLTEIGPQVKPGQIVFDVTSIKARPVEQMQQVLNTRNILGTHPVFGPGAKDLRSQNFVLTPTSEVEMDLARKAKAFLEMRGARVSVMSPKEHDEIMAVVLGLAHYISIVAADTLAGLDRLAQMKMVGGSTYRVLSTLVESVISEDPELYATLQMNLPGLVEIESQFQQNAARWAELVRSQDKAGFKESMTVLKRKFAEGNSNFGQAYENMYKIMEWL